MLLPLNESELTQMANIARRANDGCNPPDVYQMLMLSKLRTRAAGVISAMKEEQRVGFIARIQQQMIEQFMPHKDIDDNFYLRLKTEIDDWLELE
jgi:hypothetical protein